MLLKYYMQYARKFGKLSSGHRTGKGQFLFQYQRRAMPKNAQTTTRFALISHASKVMLKILQARLQQYMNWELPDIQAGFRKAEEPVFKLPTFIQSWRKQGNSRKISTLLYCLCLNPLTVWIPTNCGKFFKRWEYQTILPVSREICMQVKKQQLEPDMKQWTVSKLRKE